MKLFLSIITCWLLLVPVWSYSQDPHFSQFHLAAADINPANTGRMEGRSRLTTLYRTQWNTVLGTTPYQTAYAAFEAQLTCINGGFFALGLLGKYDWVGDIQLTRSIGHLSLAYHHALDRGTRFLSAGFQVGLISSRFQLDELQFDEQFDGVGFNAALPSFEEVETLGNTVTDLNLGISYYHTELFTVGVSLFHVTQPNNSFFQDTDFRMGLGLGVHAAFQRDISPWGGQLYFRRQSLVNNRQWYLLFLPHHRLFRSRGKNGKEFRVGLGGRLGGRNTSGPVTFDAVIVNLLFKTGKNTFGLNYDFNISSLSAASGTFGALELAFIIPIVSDDECVYCPM